MNQPDSALRVELALRIAQLKGELYTVVAQVRMPDGSEQVLDNVSVSLPGETLTYVSPPEYGQMLSQLFFADGRLIEFIQMARGLARDRGAPLRVQLLLDSSAARLHELRWETLLLPDGERLALAEDVLFSRYLAQPDWPPVQVRAPGRLNTVLLIAAPVDMARYSLPVIDGEYEHARISSAFSDFSLQSLGSTEPATLANLIGYVGKGCDVLAISAQISGDGDAPLFWLERDDGRAIQVPVTQIAAQLRKHDQLPQLLVLLEPNATDASEAQRADWAAAQAAVALAAVGIPAVICVPANAELAERFLRTCLSELAQDGRVDRSVAAARRALSPEVAWWSPLLFSRVSDGLIWRDSADPGDAYAAGPGDAPVEQTTDPYGYATKSAVRTQRAAPLPPSQPTDPYATESADEPEPVTESVDTPVVEQTTAEPVTESGDAPPVQQTVVEPAESVTELGDAPPVVEQTTVEPATESGDAPPVQQTVVEPAESVTEPAIDPAIPPPFAPPRDNPITVIVNALEDRYQPPERALVVAINRAQVTVTYDERRYRSPLTLVQEDLLAAGLPRRYGELLFQAIFSDTALPGFEPTRLAYDRARSDAGDLLRMIFDIDSQDSALTGLKWEFLCDPRRPNDPPLSAVERAPLYRLQGGGVAQPVEARPLRVLVAICNPPGLADPKSSNTLLRNLAAIDPLQQYAIAEDALKRIATAGLIEYRILGGPNEPPATLKAIREAIEDGFQVLHLVAHGLMIKDSYHVVIEQEAGQLPFVPADTLRNILTGRQLQLVLLAPCRSAEAAEAVQAAGQSLGMLLVNGGIPAVIAMQDLVQMTTVQYVTQHFYDDLARSGRVDTALAATRFALYNWLGEEDGDWGTPVLYLGVSDGQLLHVDVAGARRLARRDPVIRGFSERISEHADMTRRIVERLEREGVSGLTPNHLNAIGHALAAPAAASDSALAPGQQREALAQLRRPLRIVAAELQDFVENHGSRLLLPATLYTQVAAALNIGKHVILIGPPGTGKTSFAQDIGRFAAHSERRFTNDVVATTASADWSTFDTIGGYVPTADQTLQFRLGSFLQAISSGDWLIIDEINRAEIDKAFGELFTVLSGQAVTLPYRIGPHAVRIIPSPAGRDPAQAWVPPTAGGPYDFVVHPNWRIIGAMNVYDRASLFAMSFAFMRRFAFIEMDVPAIDLYDTLVPRWIGTSGLADAERSQLLARVRRLLAMRLLMSRRALGPAIIKDLVQHVCECYLPNSNIPDLLCESFALYAVPQLDALDQESIVGIYQALLEDFSDVSGVPVLLARIRMLYPHIREEEWPV